MRRRALLSAAAGTVAAGATTMGAGAAPAAAHPGGHKQVRTGLQNLIDDGWKALAGGKVGMVSNPTGVDSSYRHAVDLMVAGGTVDIVGVFGPEHGFRGSAQAGSSEGTSTDPRTGLTVYDAYGASQDDWASMFRKAGIDTVVYDIQDVGARFYTYIWTLYDSMVAAARLGLRYVVLDRPNPCGGRAFGPMMTAGYESGVGKKEIVQQHGMTTGELARFYNGEFLPAAAGRPVELSVVRVSNWRTDQLGTDLTYLPWVLPSPNMPTQTSALVYPGTCMFEGTNAAEGRGTTRPFELIGAPYLDYHWTDRLNAADLPGVRFREAYFTPTFNKYANTLCNGTEVQIVDAARYDPIATAVTMLVEAKKYDGFAWRYDDYDPVRPYWVDKLTGSPRLRTMIDDGASASEVVDAWSSELSAFRARRRRYLLYSGPGR
ncbi:hypothetical protein Athai_36180 [Actinocatenispora thailandica]|uniref:DUF1343 domain-containing protein n=1 Tax=Actinocatenispora thailandica TaxID=227318 RepID=A0A7R7DQP0_9ACTN|nr:DUF1343 domain-containing protein [Actinocatenispora thailandica]BCJ36115.1 hypothetical protein Athai_36180 [Actinocatenispora thailandica]